MNICDLCIKEKIIFRRLINNHLYCALEQNIKGLIRKYGKLTPDDDESYYNFNCLYRKHLGNYNETKKD